MDDNVIPPPWSIDQLLAHLELGMIDKTQEEREKMALDWGWDYKELIDAVIAYKYETKQWKRENDE
jgi:hypothetical protein